MKFRLSGSVLGIVTLAFLLLTSCQDQTIQTYMANIPVYQSVTEWRNTTFQLESPKEIRRGGKIYLWNDYLLVNEYLEGVHVIDNSNPASPTPVAFIPVLANVDMAVVNNKLYLDSYTDLLVFDFSNPESPQYLTRLEDVFDFNDFDYYEEFNPAYPMANVTEDQGVIIGWQLQKVTENAQTRWGRTGGWGWAGEDVLFNTTTAGADGNAGPNNFPGRGIAGSTARFSTKGEYLYTLERSELGVIHIAGDPVHVTDIDLFRNCETLFPFNDQLYIGTQSGMLIYDVSNPASPSEISVYDHWWACDPVVVDGEYAYVTLSSGNTCRGTNVNELQIINIQDLENPFMEYSFNMTNPKGMGLDGTTLFLCDGPDGLKVFDKSNPANLLQNQLASFPDITSNDVIPYNGVLIMTAEEGIYQYDYSDLNDIYQLSLIPVNP